MHPVMTSWASRDDEARSSRLDLIGLRGRPRTRAHHLAPSDGSFGVWARRDHDELTAGKTSVPRGGGRVCIWDTNPALFGTRAKEFTYLHDSLSISVSSKI